MLTIIIVHLHTQTIMVHFVWFKAAAPPLHFRLGDWRSSLTESGGLFVTMALVLQRVMWPVSNWVSAVHQRLESTLGIIIIYVYNSVCLTVMLNVAAIILIDL